MSRSQRNTPRQTGDEVRPPAKDAEAEGTSTEEEVNRSSVSARPFIERVDGRLARVIRSCLVVSAEILGRQVHEFATDAEDQLLPTFILQAIPA